MLSSHHLRSHCDKYTEPAGSVTLTPYCYVCGKLDKLTMWYVQFRFNRESIITAPVCVKCLSNAKCDRMLIASYAVLEWTTLGQIVDDVARVILSTMWRLPDRYDQITPHEATRRTYFTSNADLRKLGIHLF